MMLLPSWRRRFFWLRRCPLGVRMGAVLEVEWGLHALGHAPDGGCTRLVPISDRRATRILTPSRARRKWPVSGESGSRFVIQ